MTESFPVGKEKFNMVKTDIRLASLEKAKMDEKARKSESCPAARRIWIKMETNDANFQFYNVKMHKNCLKFRKIFGTVYRSRRFLTVQAKPLEKNREKW